jgi:hypothetical protein
MTTAEPLRYPPGDNAHRPFPHDLGCGIGPTMNGVLVVDGCGYCSPELTRLVDYYGADMVRKACQSLRVRPTRQNTAALRDHLEVTL